MVFTRSLHQDDYTLLMDAFEAGLPEEAVECVFKVSSEMGGNVCKKTVIDELKKKFKKHKGTEINASFHKQADDVPDPIELLKCDKNLMIFDDLITEKQQ